MNEQRGQRRPIQGFEAALAVGDIPIVAGFPGGTPGSCAVGGRDETTVVLLQQRTSWMSLGNHKGGFVVCPLIHSFVVADAGTESETGHGVVVVVVVVSEAKYSCAASKRTRDVAEVGVV